MKKIIISVVIITSFIVGGGIYSWQRGEALRVEKNNMEKINRLEVQVKTLMTNADASKGVTITSEPETSKIELGSAESFAMYGMDKNVQQKEINFYVAIDKSITTSEKIKVLVDKLSRFKFNDLPIELVEINEENGKKIAVINLKEGEMNQERDWRSGYFQGSAGGTSTSYSLIETILQKKYTGEWIHGVKFLYDSKPINDDWQHVPELSKVNYRN